MKSSAFLSLVLLFAAASQAEDIFPFPVHQQTLENGLNTVVIPYDSPGTIAFYLVVRSGSRDEVEEGHSGFAHFFEHMMFRGTENYSSDDYNDVLKRMGADTNAYTSDDRTVYHIVGPAAGLATMMEIESDRFKNLSYTEDDFKREANAVLGEYNKNISSPFLPMFERMRDLAFDRHTYGHTTMGYLADIQAMPGYFDYSLSFFDRHYRPENVILLVIGDVDPEQVNELAERHFGDWERGYDSPTIEAEPAQEAANSDHIGWQTPISPHLMVGYRAPSFSDTSIDTAALDLLGQLLFAESAPLYQKLVVEEQWVDFVSGSYSDHRDPYLFMIFSRIKSEEYVARVQATMREYIEQLQDELVDDDRLQRIKSYLRYSFALSLDSPGAVAETVANYLVMTGDPDSVNRVYAQYQSVTPADIQRIARDVFQETNSTTITLSFEGGPGAQASEGR